MLLPYKKRVRQNRYALMTIFFCCKIRFFSSKWVITLNISEIFWEQILLSRRTVQCRTALFESGLMHIRRRWWGGRLVNQCVSILLWNLELSSVSVGIKRTKGYVSEETAVLRRRGVCWIFRDNLVLSIGLIMWIGHRKEIRKLTFRRRANPVDKTKLPCRY